MPAQFIATSTENGSLSQEKPAGARATTVALPTMATTANAISSHPPAVGGTIAYCQSENQAIADSLVQSDQSPQMTVKVASVFSPTPNAARQLNCPVALLRTRPRFISHSEFTTTKPARIDQNSTSLASHNNFSRSQNHCTACRATVITNTTSLETTSPATGPQSLIRKYTG